MHIENYVVIEKNEHIQLLNRNCASRKNYGTVHIQQTRRQKTNGKIPIKERQMEKEEKRLWFYKKMKTNKIPYFEKISRVNKK